MHASMHIHRSTYIHTDIYINAYMHAYLLTFTYRTSFMSHSEPNAPIQRRLYFIYPEITFIAYDATVPCDSVMVTPVFQLLTFAIWKACFLLFIFQKHFLHRPPADSLQTLKCGVAAALASIEALLDLCQFFQSIPNINK